MHKCILTYNPPMRTTIALDSGVRDRLADLKRAWKLRSLEEVLQRLLEGGPQGAKALYEHRRQAVDKVLSKYQVRRLVAFGSRARGDARPDSDLDLVAALPPEADLFDMVHLKDDLEEAFGLEVNLVSAGGLKGRLKEHVQEDGVVLVG